MNEWVKKLLKQITPIVLSTAIITTATLVGVSQVTFAVINEKMVALEARTAICERNLDKMRDDIYRPTWIDKP